MYHTLSGAMVAQHLLVFFLVVVRPLWDRYEIPRLKASTDPRKKVRMYGKVITISWICALIAAAASGLGAVITIRRTPGEISWLDFGSYGKAIIAGITAGMLIAIFLPAVMAPWSEKIRTKVRKAAKPLTFLLPSTPEERRWWWLVCLTAGICEEVVYRGFLLHYFHKQPFHLSLIWALVASSVIFGIGHLYQGVVRTLPIALLGFVLGAIFVATGNLLLPIIVHAAMDLRVLAMLPEGFEKLEEQPAP